MKRIMQVIAIALCLVMGLSCMPSGNMSNEVSASYYYLDDTYVNATAGDTFTLHVKGTSKTVKWSTSNAKIATVKNGKVTTKNPGSCYIYAKVGGKKLTCTVNLAVNPTKALKKMKYTYTKVDRGVIVTITNTNTYTVHYTADLVLKATGGALVDSIHGDMFYIPAKSTAKMFFKTVGKEYSTCKMSGTISSYTASSARNKLNLVTSNVGDDGKVVCEFKNTSKQKISYIYICVIYYDEAGNPVDYEDTIGTNMLAGTTQYLTMLSCRDGNGYDLDYSTYKIFVNSAVYSTY